MIGLLWTAFAFAQEAPPIVNGEETSGYLEVGALMSVANNGSGYNFCSGTLVDKRYVITAAHCVEAIDDNERYGYGTHYFVVASDLYSESSIIEYAEIVEWESHPSYNDRNLAYDIGILRLGNDITATDPMPVNDDRPEESWGDITYVGWGITGDNRNDSGTKRTVDIPIAYVNSTHVITYDTDTNICSGDSGGAALAIEDGLFELVGANSYIFNINGGNPTCDGSGGAGASTRVDTALDWLEEFTPLLRVEDMDQPEDPGDDGGSGDGGSGDGGSGDGGVDNDTGESGGGPGGSGGPGGDQATLYDNPARPSEVGLQTSTCSSVPSRGSGPAALFALAGLALIRRRR